MNYETIKNNTCRKNDRNFSSWQHTVFASLTEGSILCNLLLVTEFHSCCQYEKMEIRVTYGRWFATDTFHIVPDVSRGYVCLSTNAIAHFEGLSQEKP